MATEPFLIQIPDRFLKESDTRAWATYLHNFLDNLSRPDGELETIETTEDVVVTHSAKLDFMTITQSVNLDTIESETTSNTASLAALLNSLPEYAISNDGTLRTLNADDAAGTISATPTQAEVENIRDAVLSMADFLATMNRDLQNKGIIGA